jgi:hypothetical protein
MLSGRLPDKCHDVGGVALCSWGCLSLINSPSDFMPVYSQLMGQKCRSRVEIVNWKNSCVIIATGNSTMFKSMH